MARERLIGGKRLSEIATSPARTSAEPAAPATSSGTPAAGLTETPATSGAAERRATVPIADFALRGVSRAATAHERVTTYLVDPKRCRAWKFHNRHEAWYTRERCQDLIESILKDGQQEPALARKIEGDPNFDYELIYGMRRRFACEFLQRPLKIRVVDLDDQKAAVLMHVENADRQDITPMERAISFTRQLREKLFRTQEELAQALQVAKGTVTKMVKAAELLDVEPIARLFKDPTTIPINGAYKVAVLLSSEPQRTAVLKAAHGLPQQVGFNSMSPAAILKFLAGAPQRSARTGVLKKDYNVGQSGRMILTRNAQGKVTVAFPNGIDAESKQDALIAFQRALEDL